MDDKKLEKIRLVMKKVIYIDEKNYGDYKNLNIVAFSLAYSGAMGNPGEILVITKDARIYSMNYAYGDMTIEMCNEVCPPLKDCQFGFFEVEETLVGWKGVPLGAGNFLVLSESIYNQLKHELLEMPPHFRYGRWIDITLNLLNTRIR